MERKDLSLEIKIEDVTNTGSFHGYASTFGGEPDSYGDVVAKGAFKNSIAKGGRNRNGIALLWNHRSDDPLGIWKSLIEDSKGLDVHGQLAMDTQIGREKHILMKMGAIKGLSIGYNTISYEYDEKKEIRTLKEVDLWEISLVTFPANVHATIQGVKAFEEASTIREFERAMRDAGLSARQTKYIISLCRDSFERERRHRDGGLGIADIQAAMAAALYLQ